jgi:transcriptional regulator with XRE-family HTH domain
MTNIRLKQARMSGGFKSSSEFARYAGVEEGTYRHHENGTRGLTAHALRKYARILNINAGWLLTGESGKNTRESKGEIKFSEQLNTNDKKALIIDLILMLSPNKRKETLRILAGFIHKQI